MLTDWYIWYRDSQQIGSSLIRVCLFVFTVDDSWWGKEYIFVSDNVIKYIIINCLSIATNYNGLMSKFMVQIYLM